MEAGIGRNGMEATWRRRIEIELQTSPSTGRKEIRQRSKEDVERIGGSSNLQQILKAAVRSDFIRPSRTSIMIFVAYASSMLLVLAMKREGYQEPVTPIRSLTVGTSRSHRHGAVAGKESMM